MDTESVVRLFKEPDEQAEVREMQQQWKEIRARLFDDEKPVTLREARRLIADLRDINFRFMVLGTRQLQVSVRKSWALKFAPPAKKSTTRKRLALVPSPALSATDVSNAA
ncbi:MAG: hypothetical protein ABI612_17310 [Betaproteobacteria bacterium]